jgi:hypothetical protein
MPVLKIEEDIPVPRDPLALARPSLKDILKLIPEK